MKQTLALIALASMTTAGASVAPVVPAAAPGSASVDLSLTQHYCSKCHNTEDWAGGLAFDSLSGDDVPKDAETWEKAIRKLRGHLMPPPGNPQPLETEMRSFVGSLETTIDKAAADHLHTETARVGLHRLNRKEYANAVHDLLDVEIDPTEILPRDDGKDGFDNVASALQVSPSFLNQYLAAARTVAGDALGNPHARAVGTTYTSEGEGSQYTHVEGLPLGTRGGIVVEHNFPVDGEYVINVASMAQALWVYNMEFENHLIVMLDHRKIYETSIGGEADQKAIDQQQDPAVDSINKRLKNIKFTTTAGPHQIGVTFRQRTYSESDDWLQSHIPGGGQDRVLRVSSFEVRGPLNAAAVSETPSRKMIFTCRPQNPQEEDPCAQKIIAGLAERAFRRPIKPADVADLMKFYTEGKAREGFEDGVRYALTAILADPEFLFRSEHAPQALQAGGVFKVDDLSLASRLSFFLWSSVPDQELLRVAEQGQLHDPAVLQAQVHRMLADPRSVSLASNFAFQWLNMAKLSEIQPDVALFPGLNGDIRQDYKEELKLFVDAVFRDDRSVLDLLTANYTYLNERIALEYGIRNVKGNQFRRVDLTDSRRFGLLGKGAVLMVTSYPNRTAPVLRGQFILERLMGTPPAAPPPNIPALKDNVEGKKALTVRELMVAHRSSPSCNACHGIMDPLGLALENFDAVGQYRARDRFAGTNIDASGELPDHTALNGPDDVRNALMKHPDQFVQALTEKLTMYAIGRPIEYTDMPLIRSIVRNSAATDYKFEPLVMSIVTSPAFQRERKDPKDVPHTQASIAQNRP